VWRFLKKLKIDLPYDSAIPCLGIYLEDYKSTYKTDTCISMYITTLFIIAKLQNLPNEKENMPYVHERVSLTQNRGMQLCPLQENG
jgi:hypothetical protein